MKVGIARKREKKCERGRNKGRQGRIEAEKEK